MTPALLFLLFGVPLFLRAAVFFSQSFYGPEEEWDREKERVGDGAMGGDGIPLSPPLSISPSSLVVVCPVKDDLNPAALESVVEAAAGLGRVVVADDGGKDGETEGWREGEKEGANPAFFRRENRTGWKAGNVNAALRAHGEGAVWFAVMDADTVVEAGFF